MKYNKNGYIIKISEDTLIQMCLSGFEAYCIKHHVKTSTKKMAGVETYGTLYGYESTLPNGKTIYSVEILSIDTSTNRTKESTENADDVLLLKRDLISSFWPQYEFLGDFHTHLYYNKDIIKNKFYEFSKGDKNHLTDNSIFWKKHNYRVGLVMTICEIDQKVNKLPCYINTSTIQFNMGNFEVFLKGYIAYEDNDIMLFNKSNDNNVILNCTSALNLSEFCDFCKTIRIKGKGFKFQHGEI